VFTGPLVRPMRTLKCSPGLWCAPCPPHPKPRSFKSRRHKQLSAQTTRSARASGLTKAELHAWGRSECCTLTLSHLSLLSLSHSRLPPTSLCRARRVAGCCCSARQAQVREFCQPRFAAVVVNCLSGSRRSETRFSLTGAPDLWKSPRQARVSSHMQPRQSAAHVCLYYLPATSCPSGWVTVFVSHAPPSPSRYLPHSDLICLMRIGRIGLVELTRPVSRHTQITGQAGALHHLCRRGGCAIGAT
jgi:hypothetical protein